jgi:probable rRNA maturation factor
MPQWRIHVQIAARYAGRARPALLRAAARAALQHQGVPPPGELSIALSGDAYLRRLNRQFLGIDAPTDVLSFPAQEPDSAMPTPQPQTPHPAHPAYLGDIAISYPRARAQAAQVGHSVQAELRLLVVHGVLHLLGHDHARPADKRRMWAAQAAILEELRA